MDSHPRIDVISFLQTQLNAKYMHGNEVEIYLYPVMSSGTTWSMFLPFMLTNGV